MLYMVLPFAKLFHQWIIKPMIIDKRQNRKKVSQLENFKFSEIEIFLYTKGRAVSVGGVALNNLISPRHCSPFALCACLLYWW